MSFYFLAISGLPVPIHAYNLEVLKKRLENLEIGTSNLEISHIIYALYENKNARFVILLYSLPYLCSLVYSVLINVSESLSMQAAILSLLAFPPCTYVPCE